MNDLYLNYSITMLFRRFKPLYWFYNLLHWKAFRHNRDAYRRYQIRKPFFYSISSKDFPDKTSKAWLDTGDSAVLAPRKAGFEKFAPELQEQISQWSANGFIVLKRFLPGETCDVINTEIESLVAKGKLRFKYGRKLMFANKRSALIRNITLKPELLAILQFLLDKEVVPFQTINFFEGSEQRAHSDSIHMTTYPLGYLIAVWIALEDTDSGNGPLFYYPGSHKLPYLLNEGFNEGESWLRLGRKDYPDYEDQLERLVNKNGYVRREFHARKGDVFIWHANLVHGGMPVIEAGRTRKSMVIHYFALEVIKYHEITERPSLIDRQL